MNRTVPGLGSVRGVLPPEFGNAEQYRGIPYGSISARFRQSKLVTAWPENTCDATKYGPLCPFPKVAIGHPITQKKLTPLHGYEFDEFRCLNLNITCPKDSTPEDGLPVVVWIHGGGNVVGTAADPGYDGAPIVHFSVEKKMPIILVTVNYRLGAFGFLASDAIREDNEATGDQGVGNYGIRDQLLAYEWVKRNIEAFGGDPNRITGMGESAGSIDTHITMCSKLFASALPFSQAILQSGVGSLTVRTVKHQQGVYEKMLSHLKLDTGSSTENLNALRKVSADDLVLSYIALGSGPVPAWQATVDNYFLATNCSVPSLSSQTYHPSVKRLLIGDCADEGLIFSMPLSKRQWTFDRVQKLAIEVLGEQQAKDVFGAYGISSDLSYDELFSCLTKLLSDAEWSQPIREVAKSFSNGDVFYYHMIEGNPFDGAHKGKAHHAVDLIYIFLTYQDHLPATLAALSETMVYHWLKFINGGQPWTVFDQKLDGASKIMLFGPEGRSVEVSENSKSVYKNLLLCEEMKDNIGRFAASLHSVPAVF
ncbi:alpha/beta-hydrolase [Cadophora sp. DSE1049]|nr:alpha/beta-hydrolase [Cadophora sp. DSE1049]